jgi:hypothetical protein
MAEPGIEPRTSGPEARKSHQKTTEAVDMEELKNENNFQ